MSSSARILPLASFCRVEASLVGGRCAAAASPPWQLLSVCLAPSTDKVELGVVQVQDPLLYECTCRPARVCGVPGHRGQCDIAFRPLSTQLLILLQKLLKASTAGLDWQGHDDDDVVHCTAPNPICPV